jgi:hypothetical protein
MQCKRGICAQQLKYTGIYYDTLTWEEEKTQETLKADSHIACCAHAVPLPCRAAKGLECVFPI